MIAARIIGASSATNVVIEASARAPDVRTLAIAKGWNGVGNIQLTINAGIDVASLVIPATIPDNCLTIINNGRIGGVINSGIGLKTSSKISIQNNGTIFGGGGVGAVGGDGWFQWTSGDARTYGSGGAGGSGAGFTLSGTVSLLAAAAGVAGSYVEYTGDVTGGVTRSWARGGTGGSGGAIGSAGSISAALPTTLKGDGYAVGTTGSSVPSAAGAAVDGDSKVTWIALGSITGTRIN